MLSFKYFVLEMKTRTPEQADKVLTRLARLHTKKDQFPRIFIKEPDYSDQDIDIIGHADEHAKDFFKKKFIKKLIPTKSVSMTQSHVNYSAGSLIRKQKDKNRPINVVEMPNGSHAVIDGHHRVIEAIAMGKENIEAKVVNHRYVTKHMKRNPSY